MTTFSPGPSEEYFIMHTWVPDDTHKALEGMHALRGLNPTDALNQIAQFHQEYQSARALGAVLLTKQTVDGKPQLDVLAPPEHPLISRDTIEVRPAKVQIFPAVKEYLEPMSDPEDKYDLLSFWASASAFYGDVTEKQLAGAQFYRLLPEWRLQNMLFQDLLTGEFPEGYDLTKQASLFGLQRLVGRVRRRFGRNEEQ